MRPRRAIRFSLAALIVFLLTAVLSLPFGPARAQDEALSVNKAAAVTRAAPETVTALAASFGGRLAAGLQNGRLAVWPDAAPDSPPKICSAHTGRINAVCFSPDAALIATASDDGRVAVWKADTLERVDHFASRAGPKALALDFSSDGGALAAGYDNGAVKVWSVAGPQPVQTFPTAHKKRVLAVAFARGDDTLLVSAGEDKMLDTWNVATGEQVTQVSLRIGHENDDNFRDLRYRAAAVASGAKRIAIAASVSHVIGSFAGIIDQHYIKIINTATGAKAGVAAESLKSVAENPRAVLAFSDDGLLLATVGETVGGATEVSVLNARTKDTIGQLSLPAKVQALQFGWRETGWQIVVADGKEVTTFPLSITKDSDAVPTEALAVATPAEAGAAPAALALGRATADVMQEAAVNLGRFAVVNRSNLNEVMDELALSRTGLVEKKTRLRLGHLVNARRFLVAKIVPVGASYHVTLWLEAVETGKVLASKDGEATSPAEVLALARSLTPSVLRAVPED